MLRHIRRELVSQREITQQYALQTICIPPPPSFTLLNCHVNKQHGNAVTEHCTTLSQGFWQTLHITQWLLSTLDGSRAEFDAGERRWSCLLIYLESRVTDYIISTSSSKLSIFLVDACTDEVSLFNQRIHLANESSVSLLSLFLALCLVPTDRQGKTAQQMPNAPSLLVSLLLDVSKCVCCWADSIQKFFTTFIRAKTWGVRSFDGTENSPFSCHVLTQEVLKASYSLHWGGGKAILKSGAFLVACCRYHGGLHYTTDSI